LKNGFYGRAMKTKFGEIEDLNVPRDMDGRFRTALFDPYARSIGIDELIISPYSKGIPTRKMSEILESIFQNRYSRSSISRITEITIEEVKRFQNRPLDGRYVAIFLDALFFYLRRDTVENEPIIFAMGIRESGEYEIMGFYISSKESHLSYSEVISDCKRRSRFVQNRLCKIDPPHINFHSLFSPLLSVGSEFFFLSLSL